MGSVLFCGQVSRELLEAECSCHWQEAETASVLTAHTEISPVGQTVQGHQTCVPPGTVGLGISENLALLFPQV